MQLHRRYTVRDSQSMNVAFDSRAGKDPRGVGRYARSLLTGLTATGRGGVTETHSPQRGRVDVYHSPWLDGALLHSPVPMVVTVHDLIGQGELLRRGLRMRMRHLAVQRAARVIVPSSAVADDVMAALEIPSDRIHVIAEAADPVFHPRPADEVRAVRERYDLPDRYLLWVGGLKSPDRHKRVVPLTRARRSMPLVLVGPSGAWARTLEDVVVTGQVPDEDLAAIYTAAHAVVFPSTEEGFGLVPLEALACGTPVVACDVRGLRETLRGRVQLLPVDDIDALIEAAEAARRPAPEPQRWSWEDAADATWSVYEAAARTPGARICQTGAPAAQVLRRARDRASGVR